jgi:hypothetical protein
VGVDGSLGSSELGAEVVALLDGLLDQLRERNELDILAEMLRCLANGHHVPLE